MYMLFLAYSCYSAGWCGIASAGSDGDAVNILLNRTTLPQVTFLLYFYVTKITLMAV